MSRYIEIKNHNFKGILNIDTGDIIYSKVSPNYKKILQADLKSNIKDTETFENKEILAVAKEQLKGINPYSPLLRV